MLPGHHRPAGLEEAVVGTSPVPALGPLNNVDDPVGWDK